MLSKWTWKCPKAKCTGEGIKAVTHWRALHNGKRHMRLFHNENTYPFLLRINERGEILNE